MLTDPTLRSQVDNLWNKLWSGGLNNPLDAIEQLSYLLFFKRLDEEEARRERVARLTGEPYSSTMPEEMRWRYWSKLPAGDALAYVKEKVFPWFRQLGAEGSSFERYMQNAEFKINKPSLLITAINTIEGMQITQQNQDVQGDLYEYLLSKLNTAGRNGQFRTPRHIIRMMVEMIAPQPGERIVDLAAGTCGFLVNAYQYILEQHTSPELLAYDAEGMPHNLVGDRLSDAQRVFLQQEALRGYDNDSGMAMLRIGSMNLMLHGIESPQFFYQDTLARDFDQAARYEVVLMNPPFKGAVDKGEVHEALPSNTTKSELLFLHQILRVLDMGGRCAVIVPDGVLFGSTTAHRELRQTIVEKNRLEGVVSMPSGVFKPYAGVSTAILFFTKGARTERVWYYDMAHDGLSLDDKRLPVAENDIPDLLACWKNRATPAFYEARAARLAALRAEVGPLQAERLRLEGERNRLHFEDTISAEGHEGTREALDALKEQVAALEAQIAPLAAEVAQLTRHFWVEKRAIKEQKYDLSASRYRSVEPEPRYYERPRVTMERLRCLNEVMNRELGELEGLLG